MHRFVSALAPALALAGLAACSAVVPGTAARLAAIDPLKADPGAIALVVILPPGLSVSPGTAVLEFGATRGSDQRGGRFVLDDIPAPPTLDLPESATARVYALTDKDAERMRAVQAEIGLWQREGEATGSLSLGIGGCAVGDGPAADAVGSVLIRLAEGGPFLPLIREARLADLLGPGGLAAIEPCNGAE